jgi:hypothetical protein
MNYIKHLTGFFDKVMRDERLHPTHISLYVSLFQFWNVQRFKNPISISRDEVMRVSKICSKATYHKCMKDLHNFSYLHYDPSFNPFRGSLVTLFNLELTHQQVQKKARNNFKNQTPAEQVLNSQQTGSEQELVPYTNNINLVNNTNSLNESEPAQNNNSKKSTSNDNAKSNSNQQQDQKEKLRQKKKEQPKFEEIKNYFAKNKWSEFEAQKFFNHYESNGWLVGGKTPMQNWQSSANNWILKTETFNPVTTAGKLNATTNKDYNEPL